MLPWTRRWKLSRELKKVKIKLSVLCTGKHHLVCSRIFAEKMYPEHESIPYIRKLIEDMAEPIEQLKLRKDKITELLTPGKQHE